jgi:outer membrane immunogenic protein
MWKIAFAACFAACVGVSGAQAADLSLKDPPSTEYELALVLPGFYMGAHGGGAFGSVDVVDIFDYNGDPRADNSFNTKGVIAGVQLGYNIQRGNFVFGVEADLGYLDLSGDKSADLPRSQPNNPNTDISAKYSTSGGLYGDLTGRVGYATGRTLLYLKGGVAFLNASLDADYTGANCTTTRDQCFARGAPRVPNPSNFSFESDENLIGWTLGAGVEYALSPSWSLKVEYQHFDFGSMSNSYSGIDNFPCIHYTTGCDAKLHGKTDTDITVDAVKVGLNYRFNRAEDPLR